MIDTSVVLDRVLEQHNIHAATCRPRKQGLVCGTCTELLERLIRACEASAAALVAAQGAA
jgi:hypothetical protein